MLCQLNALSIPVASTRLLPAHNAGKGARANGQHSVEWRLSSVNKTYPRLMEMDELIDVAYHPK